MMPGLKARFMHLASHRGIKFIAAQLDGHFGTCDSLCVGQPESGCRPALPSVVR